MQKWKEKKLKRKEKRTHVKRKATKKRRKEEWNIYLYMCIEERETKQGDQNETAARIPICSSCFQHLCIAFVYVYSTIGFVCVRYTLYLMPYSVPMLNNIFVRCCCTNVCISNGNERKKNVRTNNIRHTYIHSESSGKLILLLNRRNAMQNTWHRNGKKKFFFQFFTNTHHTDQKNQMNHFVCFFLLHLILV